MLAPCLPVFTGAHSHPPIQPVLGGSHSQARVPVLPGLGVHFLSPNSCVSDSYFPLNTRLKHLYLYPDGSLCPHSHGFAALCFSLTRTGSSQTGPGSFFPLDRRDSMGLTLENGQVTIKSVSEKLCPLPPELLSRRCRAVGPVPIKVISSFLSSIDTTWATPDILSRRPWAMGVGGPLKGRGDVGRAAPCLFSSTAHSSGVICWPHVGLFAYFYSEFAVFS